MPALVFQIISACVPSESLENNHNSIQKRSPIPQGAKSIKNSGKAPFVIIT
jgi:hypothetical protein